MKLFETIKHHPRTTAAVAVLLGASAIEVIGLTQNPTYDRPGGSCVSPIAASSTYVDRGANLVLQTQAGLFTTGVVAEGVLPHGASGIEASFKAPDADAATWDANTSRMIKANEAGEFALKMAIGPSEVQFGVRLVAPEGSPLCDAAPQVTFTHKDAGGYFGASGNLPWPNPASAVVNIF